METAVPNWSEYLLYDEHTGDLIRRERPRCEYKTDRAWGIHKTRDANKIAGSVGPNGRRYIRVLQVCRHRSFQAHRIVWEMVKGPIPEGMSIDHINGNPLDNRINNLRIATHSQNLCNRLHTKANLIGLKGVRMIKKNGVPTGRFSAVITVRQTRIALGRFSTKGTAAVAHAKASLMYHGKFSPFYRKAA